MSRHLRRWLNDKALNEFFNGEYEGRIADVVEEYIRNRFTGQRQLEPVVLFEDGWRLLPNIGQRRALIQMFGQDTEDWIGQPIIVYRHTNNKTDPKTGIVRQTWEKRVRLPVRANGLRPKSDPLPAWTPPREPGEDDDDDTADYEDEVTN